MATLLLFVHLVGVFGFLLAHGVSAGVALRLRRVRQPAHVRALLDLSSAMTGVFYVCLLILLGGGVGGAFVQHLWGKGWIWAAVGVLVLTMGSMYAIASPYYEKLRQAAGMQTFAQRKKGVPANAPVSAVELDALLGRPQPLIIAAMGSVGLVVLLWLMVLKPF